jgi:GNAT superfamily N-acetyltransferase
MLAVLRASKLADGLDDADTLEGLIERYAQTSPAELATNMLMAEAGGQLVGYGRTYAEKEVRSPTWRYNHRAYVRPGWQRRGLGTALMDWLEARAVAVAREQAQSRPAAERANEAHWHQVYCFGPEVGKAALLAGRGYAQVRHFYRMVRPDLKHIPDCPLPAGLEVRAVRAEHLRAIWEANVEAFSDHWGEPEHPESDYQGWLRNGEFQPEIWKVAWDTATDQVAGMVLGFIDYEQNKQQRLRRGWTENICVRRPWRRRGLARALIAASLRELKARGMAEAALGVDTENVSGALQIYESLGFRAGRKDTLWRKPLEQF